MVRVLIGVIRGSVSLAGVVRSGVVDIVDNSHWLLVTKVCLLIGVGMISGIVASSGVVTHGVTVD